MIVQNVKFKNGLRPELKQGIVVLDMNDYGHLVQKTKEFEEAYNERASAYRNFKGKQAINQGRGKQALTPRGQDFKKKGYTRFGNSLGGSSGGSAWNQNQIRCVRCGKSHHARDCKEKDVICFRCNKPGHISRDCTNVKSEPGNERKP